MKRVKAIVGLLKHQTKVLNSTKTIKCMIGGFGSGKTETGILFFFKLMEENGIEIKEKYGDTYTLLVFEPTYRLVVDVLHVKFVKMLNKYNIPYDLNKGTNNITIEKFNTVIMMRSLENESKIIGYEAHDFWIDELDTLNKIKAKRVFDLILGRVRLNKVKGINSGLITSTPEGKHRFLYERFGNLTNEEKEENELISASTYDNTTLPKGYIRNMEKNYDPKLLDAYLRGKFVNLTGSLVYYNYSQEKNNTSLIVEDFEDDEVLHIGMDFNIENMSCVVCVNNKEENELYVLNEFKKILDTPHMINRLKEEYPGRTLRIYPDASSQNRNSSDASVTDLILLKKEKNFQVVVGDSNPRIRDRVISVNSMFENGLKEVRLFINSKQCSELTENLEQQTYNQKTGQPDKENGQDHIIDALGYVVFKLYPVLKQLSKNFNK